MNYDLLLAHYQVNGRAFSRAESLWFAGQPSLKVAIDTAARAIDSRGKRYRHQLRIRRAAIARARPALLKARRRIESCKTFDELLQIITTALKDIPWIGELYLYDTAFRVGSYLKLRPTKIHLHAGARDGARALGLDYRARAIELTDVPEALQVLKPHEIEDFLCIYKGKVIRSICGS